MRSSKRAEEKRYRKAAWGLLRMLVITPMGITLWLRVLGWTMESDYVIAKIYGVVWLFFITQGLYLGIKASLRSKDKYIEGVE